MIADQQKLYDIIYINFFSQSKIQIIIQVTTQAPETTQTETTQAPESIFEEEGSGGFGGNSFEGMDMSQFDTYDYGYEDDDRSEEIQDSFENISSSTERQRSKGF